ncbi:MAG: hypothetical protein U0U66_04740 [Cytophagaceae bacterium]
MFFGTWLLLACQLSSEYYVRITNQNSDDLINVTVGSAKFGAVTSGSTTSYYRIPEGNSAVNGQYKSNPTVLLKGSVTATGNGNHKWTVTISSTGTLSVKED